MNLKLSYRDKVIFISVMIILVLVAGFFLLIRPKFDAVETAKQNLEAQQQKKAEIEAKIKTLPDLIQQIKDTAKVVGEKQEIFLDEFHPYQNETYIRELLKSLDLTIKSMSTEYTVAAPITEYLVSEEHVIAYENKINTDLYNELPQIVYDRYNGVADPEPRGTYVGVTHMNVTTVGKVSSDELYGLINRFAEDEKTIILNTISTKASETSSSSGGQAGAEAENKEEPKIDLAITMYSVYPLNVDKVMEETDEVKVPAE